MINTYFFDVKANTIKPLPLSSLWFLEGLYENIGCDLVTAVDFPGGTIWLDEEFLPKKNLLPFRFMGKIYVGNAVITGPDEDDAWLTIEHVASFFSPQPMVIDA